MFSALKLCYGSNLMGRADFIFPFVMRTFGGWHGGSVGSAVASVLAAPPTVFGLSVPPPRAGFLVKSNDIQSLTLPNCPQRMWVFACDGLAEQQQAASAIHPVMFGAAS